MYLPMIASLVTAILPNSCKSLTAGTLSYEESLTATRNTGMGICYGQRRIHQNRLRLRP
jgi:hypothetical protein